MMIASVPRISVVMPAYNAAATIESALASIQAQSVRDIVIIVVNDGSTDATREIVERLAAADPRIRVLNQANGGIVDALNAGLALCTTELVARHDADDLALPDRFEKQVTYLQAHPDCVAVSGAVRHIDNDGRLLKAKATLPSPDLSDPGHFPQIEPYLIHPFLMVRCAAIEEVGGYRYVFHAEDTDLYWRLQDMGRLFNMPDILGDYRIHAGSISGVSVVNGRVSAMNSQRAGISALRRRRGRPDIAFPKSFLGEYEAARSLEGMLRVASRGLDEDESGILALSAGLKLLESAAYRPYEVETEDCVFIRSALERSGRSIRRSNRALCERMISGAAARLIQHGKTSSAIQLLPPALYPAMAVRLLLRVAMPKMARKMIQKAVGRDSTLTK
ncbi:MAG: glycosyltransferase family 2 protein [Janthinobacterium lividum]